MKRVLVSCSKVFAASLLAGALLPASAQEFTRPVAFIFPFSPGASTDLYMRAMAPEMSKAFGVPVVVENRVGAGGRLGLQAVMQAPKDPHIITFVSSGIIVLTPLASSKFKPEVGKDYSPVAIAYQTPLALYANPQVPFRDVKGLIAYAKANPGKLNGASAGAGSNGHITFELLNAQAGIDIVHVGYKGDADAAAALVGGQVQLYVTAGSPKPLVDAGKVVVIATTGRERWHLYGERPTVRESGVPQFESASILGFVTGAGVPPDTVAKMNAVIRASNKVPEIVKPLLSAGSIADTTSTPAQYTEAIRKESELLAPIVKKAGIKFD